MIQFLDVSEQDTVAARVVGQIDEKDVEKAAKEIDRRLEEEGLINMYLELDHFEGYEPKALFKDLRLMLRHFDNFKKVALVSQEEWLDAVSEITENLDPGVKARYYRIEERPQALRWLEKE